MDLISRLVDRFTLTTKNEVVAIYPDDQGGFIDGNFDSWQSGSSFTLPAATDTYTADMWVCNAGTGGAATVTQNPAALGSEITGMARPRVYRLAHAQTTAASTNPTIGQKLESVFQYNGQSVTISGTFAAAAAGTDIVGVQLTQNFGTGGTPSASVVTTKAVTWVLTTTEQRFSVRMDVPSISGETLGANGDDFLRVDFLLATGATYTVYASQIQADVCAATASADTTGSGGSPQPFRWRGVGLERTRVNRYVQSSTWLPSAGVWLCFLSTTTTSNGYASLPGGKMRATPAVAILSGAWFPQNAAPASYTNSANGTSNTSYAMHCTNTGTPWTAGGVDLFFTSGAGTSLLFDSRL